jgi:hypothetical protein
VDNESPIANEDSEGRRLLAVWRYRNRQGDFSIIVLAATPHDASSPEREHELLRRGWAKDEGDALTRAIDAMTRGPHDGAHHVVVMAKKSIASARRSTIHDVEGYETPGMVADRRQINAGAARVQQAVEAIKPIVDFDDDAPTFTP